MGKPFGFSNGLGQGYKLPGYVSVGVVENGPIDEITPVKTLLGS